MEERIEVLEEKKKSNKGIVFLIIALILIISGLVSYILLDKGIIKIGTYQEKTVKEEKVSNTKKIALDDNRFYGIYKKLLLYTYTKNRSDGYESFSGKELLNISCDQLKESDFNKTTDVRNEEYKQPIYTIKGSVIDKYLMEYFGSDLYFDKTDLAGAFCATPNVNFEGSGLSVDFYDKRTDEIRAWFSGIGGTTGPQAKVTERKIVSANIKDDVITIKEKAIYYEMNVNEDYSNINYKIYSDREKLNEIDSIDFTVDTAADGKISVDSYKDKASTITQVFKLDKDTNKYYFASSKIEE